MPLRSNVITDDVTEMPRCCSICIQSERVRRRSPRALTAPAIWMAPPNRSSFSVSVVLPASGCEMIANVRRRVISGLAVCSAGTGWGIRVKGSGLDQLHLTRLEPDLMIIGRLAENFADMQFDQTIVDFDDRKCLAEAAAKQRLQLLVVGRQTVRHPLDADLVTDIHC